MQGLSKKRRRINNKGVTLIELIIAVAILGIVVTPLLHAFITSARINAKARDTLNETTLSENLMEEFNDAKVDDMVAKYGGTEFADGCVDFIKVDHDLLNGELDSDVYVDIYLDPTTYTNENNVNLVNLQTITSSDCAIYSMPLTYDSDIYEIFENNSASANATDPGVYTYKNKDFFEKNLDRTIYLYLTKTGETDEGIPLVRVEMNIVYEWNGAGAYLLSGDRRYTTKTKELFDNSKTEIELNGLYFFFLPRFKAAHEGHKDEIRILNLSNVPATTFIVRQEMAEAEETQYLSEYKTRLSAEITVIEDDLNIPFSQDTVSALQLRTNMHEELLSSHSEIEPAKLNCALIYKNQAGTQTANSELSKQILKVTTLDGKTLDNTTLENRIYEMKIEIYTEETVSGTLQREVLSTMVGTKVN